MNSKEYKESGYGLNLDMPTIYGTNCMLHILQYTKYDI